MKSLNRSVFIGALLLFTLPAQGQTTSSTVTGTQRVIFPEKKDVIILPDGRVVYDKPDQQPVYPGDLDAYVSGMIKVPNGFTKKKAQGRATIRFIVTSSGQTSDVEIINSSGDPYLDQEVLRVVRQMNGWRPGTHDGLPVAVFFKTPINIIDQKPNKSNNTEKMDRYDQGNNQQN